MKISLIGAGNVGGLTAMRLAEENIGEIILVDNARGLAAGKTMDLEDGRWLLKFNSQLKAGEDILSIKDSDFVIVTAGLTRKSGMTREELLQKNALILKDISLKIKELAASAIVILVTNPVDLMTYFVLKIGGFDPKKVLGMGLTLDASRFANFISAELKISPTDIDPWVIGPHGEGMQPLTRFTTVKGTTLEKILPQETCANLIKRTVGRGEEIVSLLTSGSAYFAPSAAIVQLVKVIAKDQKRILGVSAYLNGEYGIKDLCIGVPCHLGKTGIEKIIELDLNKEEKAIFFKSAQSLRQRQKELPLLN